MNITAIPLENNVGLSYETLIPVRMGEIGGKVMPVCNAKDVYLCVGVGRRFTSWIAGRIEEYGFVEGIDFAKKVSPGSGRNSKGGRPGHEYTVSSDMAKELAMVERTEEGRRIRRYFIACEEKLREIAPAAANDLLRKALNPEQQSQLKQAVDTKVACLAKARQRAGYSELWSGLKARHQVAQYRDIPQAEFEDARQFVESYEWEGEWIGKGGSDTLELSREEVAALYLMMSHYHDACAVAERAGLYAIAKLSESRPLMSLREHLMEAGFAFKRLDQRRDEIYRIYRSNGSVGGYAMRDAA